MCIYAILKYMRAGNMIDWNEIFDYKDGELYWKINRSTRIKKGSKAGYLHHKGYMCVLYQNKSYSVHRIVWEMHNWPIPSNKEIDHADRNKANNKIENLRCCSRSQNCQNPSMRNNNTSGHTGVCWHKTRKKWSAYITINGKKRHLGWFNTLEEAIAARKKAEQELGWNQF